MTSQKILKLIIAAMFAALCCICTMLLPIPSSNGYIHLGDGMVILSGILLGPIYGCAAAGIGSMLADLFSGYPMYAIATLLIKALAALVAWLIFRGICKLTKDYILRVLSVIVAGIGAGFIVSSLYFLFDMTIMGAGLGAVSGIPGNLLQNIFGIIISTIMFPALYRIPTIRNFSQTSESSSTI